MFLKRDHPQFDEALELLARLPQLPGAAPIKLLCEDFGFEHQRDLNPLIERLGCYDVTRCNMSGGNGRGLRVGRLPWRNAYAAAKKYLDTVYGEQLGATR